PTGGAWPCAWWCRGCGEYRPVDDREHCRRCVPPMAEVLTRLIDLHQGASRALGEAGMPILDPERLWHADLARDALVLLHRLQPDVLAEDADDSVDERTAPQTTVGLERSCRRRVALIQEAVAAFYGLSVDELRGPQRTRDVVVPRQVAMFLVREETASSLPAIGRAFGGRDHTTVHHACRRVRELGREQDALVRGDLAHIRAVLAGARR
ncbi:MAG: helix-turn-helix domain-containing protein, partial [Candidatus Dormibacteria bacterium]